MALAEIRTFMEITAGLLYKMNQLKQSLSVLFIIYHKYIGTLVSPKNIASGQRMPLINSKYIHYNCDGTGRDSYIMYEIFYKYLGSIKVVLWLLRNHRRIEIS